jgi:hypothetical protein
VAVAPANPAIVGSDGVGEAARVHVSEVAHRFWAAKSRNMQCRWALHNGGFGRSGMVVRGIIWRWWPLAHGLGRSRETVGSSLTSMQAQTVAGHGCPRGGTHSGRSGGVGGVRSALGGAWPGS